MAKRRKATKGKIPFLITATAMMFGLVTWRREYSARMQYEAKNLIYKDYIYRDGGNPPIVIESHKLIFFEVQKVGSTEWLKIFIKMMGGEPEGMNVYGKDNGLKRLSDYPLDEANRMMLSPQYTKAVFVRDPKERFLSAYLDRVFNKGYMKQNSCCEFYGDKDECNEKLRASFDFFYERVATIQHCWDIHWRPQVTRIDEKFWPLIDFVGHHETVAQDAENLLRRIGAWDQYGKTGWGVDKSLAFMEKPPTPEDSHATNARDKMLAYYTPELERRVEDMMKGDYENPYMKVSLKKIFDSSGVPVQE